MKKLNNLLMLLITNGIFFLGAINSYATVCGTDTVRFTMEKASGYGSIAINNVSSATSLGQYYTAPQAVTIYGFDFYGSSETLPVMTINAYVYRAGPDSLPIGSPLASATISVDSSTDTNLNQVMFATPLTVTFPYLLIVSNPSANSFAIFSNDWLAGDGNFDNLSSAQIGVTWFHASDLSVGGSPYNADAIFNPYVSYTLIANDTITPVPYCTGGTANFADKSSPIIHDPIYSVAAFYDLDSLQYTYDVTGYPTVYDDAFSIPMPPIGTYTVNQTDTMFTWTGFCTASVTKSFTVVTTPVAPTGIAGPTTLCSGGGATYTVTAVPYATSYVWTLPSGWTGTSTTNSITVTAGASSGNVSVYARNGCGNSGTTTLAVTSSGTITIPGPITGLTSPCAGTSVTYTISPVAGATSYAWSLPSGWSGTSTDTTITCTAGAASGNIGVSAVSIACGSSAPSTLMLTPLNVPDISGGNIFVPSPLCSGSTNLLIIIGVSNAISYTWTLPSGWTGSSTTDSMMTTVSTTSGSIQVTATNGCGTSAAYTRTATVILPPVAPGTITGDATPCFGGAADYSIAAVAGATSYIWTLPAGWSGTSSTTMIHATNDMTAGVISVVAVNVCGSSTASTLSLSPAAAGISATLTPHNTSSASAGDGSIVITAPTGGTAPYQYSIDSMTFQSTPLFGALLPGTYTITIKDTNGCISSMTVVVAYNTNIGIANNDLIRSVNIFPNPASTTITVNAEFANNIQLIDISIFDLIGNKLITHQYNNQSAISKQLDISALPAGNYIIKINADDIRYNDKLTIIK